MEQSVIIKKTLDRISMGTKEDENEIGEKLLYTHLDAM
jgi:hypothetical protein